MANLFTEPFVQLGRNGARGTELGDILQPLSTDGRADRQHAARQRATGFAAADDPAGEAAAGLEHALIDPADRGLQSRKHRL